MTKLTAILALAAMGVEVGCAANVETPRETELTSAPIAKVEADGHTFEFFEIEPGIVVTREMAAVNMTFTLAKHELQNLPPLDLFHALAPNAEAPASLLEASDRWVAAHRDRGAHVELATAQQPISIEPENGSGCVIDGDDEYNTTTTSWLWSKQWDDVDAIQTYACNSGDKGTSITVAFKYRRWWDWTSIKSEVPPGHYAYWYACDWSYDFDVQFSVLNPSLNRVRIAKQERFY
jgi:hypothetical protein